MCVGNEWVHLAATFDATTGTIALYVDSIKQTSTQTGLQASNGGGDLVIGSGVTGDVDDARVHSGAMADQDVRDLYFATKHY